MVLPANLKVSAGKTRTDVCAFANCIFIYDALSTRFFFLILCSLFQGLPRNEDGLLVTEVDLNLCRQVRDKWGFQVGL